MSGPPDLAQMRRRLDGCPPGQAGWRSPPLGSLGFRRRRGCRCGWESADHRAFPLHASHHECTRKACAVCWRKRHRDFFQNHRELIATPEKISRRNSASA